MLNDASKTLYRLKFSVIGYHMGRRTYASVFRYPDDMAFLATHLGGLKGMIKIYEAYAEKYHSLSNSTKFKLLCYNLLSDAILNVIFWNDCRYS